MITGRVITEDGVVIGRVKTFDFLCSLLSIKMCKNDNEVRFITLYPLKGYPFYKDYEKLHTHPYRVQFQMKGEKND